MVSCVNKYNTYAEDLFPIHDKGKIANNYRTQSIVKKFGSA